MHARLPTVAVIEGVLKVVFMTTGTEPSVTVRATLSWVAPTAVNGAVTTD
jgi:hypothetical protein